MKRGLNARAPRALVLHGAEARALSCHAPVGEARHAAAASRATATSPRGCSWPASWYRRCALPPRDADQACLLSVQSWFSVGASVGDFLGLFASSLTFRITTFFPPTDAPLRARTVPVTLLPTLPFHPGPPLCSTVSCGGGYCQPQRHAPSLPPPDRCHSRLQ